MSLEPDATYTRIHCQECGAPTDTFAVEHTGNATCALCIMDYGYFANQLGLSGYISCKKILTEHDTEEQIRHEKNRRLTFSDTLFATLRRHKLREDKAAIGIDFDLKLWPV